MMKSNVYSLLSLTEGCFLVALGIWFLTSNHLLVGGTAGFSALLYYQHHVSFGFWFFLLNFPFFLLAIKELSFKLAINSVIAITLVSLFSFILDKLMSPSEMPLLLSAIIGGLLIGIGTLLVFRANATLGGINILGVILEKHRVCRYSYTLMISDSILAITACAFLPVESVIFSLLSFSIFSFVVDQHRKQPGSHTHSTQKFKLLPIDF